MKPKKLYGFSLLEVLAVLAIVGVVAAIFLPSYRDYIVKTRISSIIESTKKIRISMEEYSVINSASPTAGVLGIGTGNFVGADFIPVPNGVSSIKIIDGASSGLPVGTKLEPIARFDINMLSSYLENSNSDDIFQISYGLFGQYGCPYCKKLIWQCIVGEDTTLSADISAAYMPIHCQESFIVS